MVDAGCNDGQRYTREDVSVVALARVESLAIVSDWQERRTTGENGSSLNWQFKKKNKIQIHYVFTIELRITSVNL